MFRLGLAASSMIIFASALATGPVGSVSTAYAETGKSMRTSICSYTIRFDHGSWALGPKESTLIQDAVKVARTLTRHLFTIEADRETDEDVEIDQKRLGAVVSALYVAGVSPREISTRTRYDMPLPQASQVFLSICIWPPLSDTLNDPPPLSDRFVDVQLLGHRLNIPLTYMAPNFWVDFPFGLVTRSAINFDLWWPDLKSGGSKEVRGCELAPSEECSSHIIKVSLDARERFEARRRRLVHEESLYTVHRKPVDGLTFATTRSYPNSVRLSGLTENGIMIDGICYLPQPWLDYEELSENDFKERFRPTKCILFYVGNATEIGVTIIVSGIFIFQWQSLITRTDRLLDSFAARARQSQDEVRSPSDIPP